MIMMILFIAKSYFQPIPCDLQNYIFIVSNIG